MEVGTPPLAGTLSEHSGSEWEVGYAVDKQSGNAEAYFRLKLQPSSLHRNQKISARTKAFLFIVWLGK